MRSENSDKFLKIVLAGVVTPFILVFALACTPFYLLGLLFNWIFNLELL